MLISISEGNRTIAFTVSTSIILRNYNNKIIKYDKVLTNKGSAYNTNTGIFTCPTTGTYVFTWSTMSGVYSNICDATIYHNGNGLLLSSSNEGGGSYEEVASNTLVLTMAVGDRVWIQTGTGTFCNGYPWTGFSGWKI
ncbi:hypothetical protein FSP39_014297 [Pinctada imbricata]|uniref:C1q domain-containing protein n=1 Tax=Pinctada imbricata TaxID=66713 RepID=A0AA89BXE1_PINIB|nr:hypothetical protein FSP39_014297 [Pinctada imbricata]